MVKLHCKVGGLKVKRYQLHPVRPWQHRVVVGGVKSLPTRVHPAQLLVTKPAQVHVVYRIFSELVDRNLSKRAHLVPEEICQMVIWSEKFAI